MKKSLVFFALIFACLCANAETIILNEDGRFENTTGLQIAIGDSFAYTERFNMFPNRNFYGDDLYSNGFSVEAGIFKSDEDGLIDIVSSHTFGYSTGRINTEDNYAWVDRNVRYCAENNAKYSNISFKDTFGPQINFFVFSAGVLLGSNVGFDWMKMNAEAVNSEHDYVYKERRLFLDFVLQPYFAFNIRHFAKIYMSTEFDFPVLKARFIRDSYYKDYHFRFDWFSGEIPSTYKIGTVLFF